MNVVKSRRQIIFWGIPSSRTCGGFTTECSKLHSTYTDTHLHHFPDVGKEFSNIRVSATIIRIKTCKNRIIRAGVLLKISLSSCKCAMYIVSLHNSFYPTAYLFS